MCERCANVMQEERGRGREGEGGREGVRGCDVIDNV